MNPHITDREHVMYFPKTLSPNSSNVLIKDNPCDLPLVPSDTFVLVTQEEEGLCTVRERQEFQQLFGSLNWFDIAPDLI